MSDSFHLQYRSALNDLTHRAEKVVINNLTTIALENVELASSVVKAIEDQLYNAHPSLKLPLVYLMDSILKNVGKNYIPAFQKNLIATFTNAFSQVSSADKEKLKKVLYTWRTHPGGFLFPSSVLSQIEGAIGVRSNQLQPQNQPSRTSNGSSNGHAQPARPPAFAALANSGTVNQTDILQQINLLIAQKETMRILQPTSQSLTSEISVLKQLAQVLTSQRLDFGTLNNIKSQIQPMLATAAVPPPPPTIGFSSISGPIGLSNLSAASGAASQLGSLDFLQSFSFPTNPIKPQTTAASISASFISSPLMSLNHPSSTPSLSSSTIIKKEPQIVPMIPKDVPVIRLTAADISKRHPGLYYHMYEAIELQCKQCALRFPSHLSSDGGKAVLDAHLDWHFRQKKKQKEKTKRAVSRDWYLLGEEWIAEQPIEPVADNQVAPVFFGQEKEELEELNVSIIPASQSHSKCEICNEALEKYFDDEEDMWMVRGAVKVGEKMYHENCYKDSSVQGTPILGKRTIEADVAEAKKVKIE